MNKWLTFILLLFCSSSIASTPLFTEVNRVVHVADEGNYLFTDTGIWLEKNNTIYSTQPGIKLTASVSDYQHLFPQPNYLSDQAGLASWVGVGFVVMLCLFLVAYLYYHWSLIQRRKAYFAKIKTQQQTLSIAFLATGDEVVDCQIGKQQFQRINKNSEFEYPQQLHFQDSDYLQKLHPEDKSLFINTFETILKQRKNDYEISYRIQSVNKAWLWITERGRVIERADNGQALRLVSCLRNITPIKKQEDHLVRVVKQLEHRLTIAEAELMK